MNAERLHAIAKAIRQDLKDTKQLALITQLRNALQNQVNQPQASNHQQQVSDTLNKLEVALMGSISNDFSPVFRQALETIGASELLGAPLLTQVQEVFGRNQITPSVALQEIEEIHKKVELLSKALDQAVSALATLNIGAEELAPGQCELGFVIPRDALKNKLQAFSSELDLLNKTFSTFSELAGGSRPGFNIRTISSSDLSVFLDLAPGVCACVAVAIERIVALYKQLLEIRSLRQQMAERGLSEKSLQGVDAHANAHMKDGIDKVIAELIEKYAAKHDEGRRNELRTELRHALNRIANRIDKGYNFEVRVEPVKESKENEEDAAKQEREAIAIAVQAAKAVQFLKPEGSPILTLPEPANLEEVK